MARAKKVSRRPLLGVLAFTIFILATGSFLSSPPWPGAVPPFGISRDACGFVGAKVADLFLGGLGLPVSLILLASILGLSFRWLFGRMRNRFVFSSWLIATAFVSSIFFSLVTHTSEYWGRIPFAAAEAAASGSLLGPLGAGILSGAALVALMFFGVPRWTPAPVVRVVEDGAGELSDRAAQLPGRLGLGATTLRKRFTELPRPSLPSWSLPSFRGNAEEGEDEEFEDGTEDHFEDEYLGDDEPGEDEERVRAGSRRETQASRRTNREEPPRRSSRQPSERVRAKAPRVQEEEPAWEAEEDFEDDTAENEPRRRGARISAEVAEGFASPVQRPTRPTRPGRDESAQRSQRSVPSARSAGDERNVPSERITRDNREAPSRPRPQEEAPVRFGAGDPDPFQEDNWEDTLPDPLDLDESDPSVVPTRITEQEMPAEERISRKKRRRGNAVLPPLTLLEAPQPQVGVVTKAEVMEKSQILVKTLEDFNIQGSVGEVHPGPVITQYEYAPAAGVRISQIVSRSDDLALNMRARRIRIVAPIPGKAAIGIEVPNDTAAHIDFRTLLQELDLSGAALPLCLGRDIRGRAQFGRLEKMPHLLVAGTTGSGKSVCLNTCIFSLLYSRSPAELRILMIDPKMLELTVYDGIPHLLCPVVTDARTASRMLQWMVGEMERRYRKMAGLGVRNIEGYHEKVKKTGTDEGEPMPYIVVIVDELADLMLTLGNEIETPIARLAQMARAVGIHLILATQRPSVDVITGVIKANFPGRIAFQVATKVDSRTILDVNGAENLLGRGDMLYLPPGQGSPVRLHGAYVSDDDASRLVDFLKDQPAPEPIFREEMLDKEAEGHEIDDELFEDALRLVVMQNQASVSFLQRRLKVGYSRAGRLMDLLEGVRAVGPHEGSKPREVFADEEFLEDWKNQESGIV